MVNCINSCFWLIPDKKVLESVLAPLILPRWIFYKPFTFFIINPNFYPNSPLLEMLMAMFRIGPGNTCEEMVDVMKEQHIRVQVWNFNFNHFFPAVTAVCTILSNFVNFCIGRGQAGAGQVQVPRRTCPTASGGDSGLGQHENCGQTSTCCSLLTRAPGGFARQPLGGFKYFDLKLTTL